MSRLAKALRVGVETFIQLADGSRVTENILIRQIPEHRHTNT